MRLLLIVALLTFIGVSQVYASTNIVTYKKDVTEHITLIQTETESKFVQYQDLAVDIDMSDGLGVQEFLSVVNCESRFNPTVQSEHRYNFNDPSRGIKAGEREQSFGLSQIHIPDHDVTIEQAQNPVFALNYMADLWEEGKQGLWSCYRMLK